MPKCPHCNKNLDGRGFKRHVNSCDDNPDKMSKADYVKKYNVHGAGRKPDKRTHTCSTCTRSACFAECAKDPKRPDWRGDEIKLAEDIKSGKLVEEFKKDSSSPKEEEPLDDEEPFTETQEILENADWTKAQVIEKKSDNLELSAFQDQVFELLAFEKEILKCSWEFKDGLTHINLVISDEVGQKMEALNPTWLHAIVAEMVQHVNSQRGELDDYMPAWDRLDKIWGILQGAGIVL